MELFVILSSSELFRQQASPDRCYELLRGLPFEALKLYASRLCHNLTAGAEAGADPAKVGEFHTWFIARHASPQFRDQVFGLVAHRAAYRRGGWALADEHRVANLVTAYAKANPSPVAGDSAPTHIDDLIRAQLIINDLVSVSTKEILDQIPVIEMVRIYSMARAWDAWTTVPRAFDIVGTRLANHLPDLSDEFRLTFRVKPSEIATVLFSVYLFEIGAILDHSEPPTAARPPWTRGVLSLADLRPSHSGEAILQQVLNLHATDWDDLHRQSLRQSPNDPSILWYLRHPLIKLGNDSVWCFDPALLLSAASNGLLWLSKEAHCLAGKDSRDVFRQLGLAFEDYVADLIQGVGRTDSTRGDELAEGLSDFFFKEGTDLVVLEAKSSTFRDDVKWASDVSALRQEIEKITKGNQLMKAITRFFALSPDLAAGVTRVVPVLVVLDPSYACPGMEPELLGALEKPAVGCKIEDPHLLYIGELETAGNYIREAVFARLLDARRSVSPNGSLALSDYLARNKSHVRASVGRSIEPFDAHVRSRAALNDAMREFREVHCDHA